MRVDGALRKQLDRFNMYSTCFGKIFAEKYYKEIVEATRECSLIPVQVSDDFSDLSIVSKNIDDVDVNAKLQLDMNHLRQEIDNMKLQRINKIGNWTCVFTKIGFFLENGDINVHVYDHDYVKGLIRSTNAGTDEDFVTSLTEGVTHCAETAINQYQNDVDQDSALELKFKRNSKFLRCVMDLEDDLCYSWQVYQGVQQDFGIDTKKVDLGLSGDKYDQAAQVMKILEDFSPAGPRFVNDFIYQRAEL